jgi:hypothetical protein
VSILYKVGIIAVIVIEHLNHRYLPPKSTVLGNLAEINAQELFQIYNVGEYIAAHRFPKFGPLDFAATASALGISIVEHPRVEPVLGKYYRDTEAISINPNQKHGQKQITFGHELAHKYFWDTFGEQDFNVLLEVFCDFFGYNLLFRGIDLGSVDPSNTQEFIEIARVVDTDLISVVEGWLVLAGVGNAIVRTKESSLEASPDLVHESPMCRCAIIGQLDCTISDTPPVIDLSEFYSFGSLRSYRHTPPKKAMEQQFGNAFFDDGPF